MNKPIEPIELSAFARLRKINVNAHTEKKNGLTYLSWAWAVDQLLSNDPNANWEYLEPLHFNNTIMVRCSVTAFGKTMTAQLPVMDHRNKPIPNPDAFQVNTAMQRCLAKAIALHGLGLYIYAGEDLPEDDKQAKQGPTAPITPTTGAWEAMDEGQQAALTDIALNVVDMIAAGDVTGAVKYIDKQGLSTEEKVALWSRFDSKQRSAMKKANEALKAQENATELAGQA